MGTITVDRFDLQLLEELQRDGQATNHLLGERVHLSASQVSRRVQRLHEAGVIDHYCALINPSAIGLDVIAFSELITVHERLPGQDTNRRLLRTPARLVTARWAV